MESARDPRADQSVTCDGLFTVGDFERLGGEEVLERTHLRVSKTSLFTTARARGVLDAGCMEAGKGRPNLGKSRAL